MAPYTPLPTGGPDRHRTSRPNSPHPPSPPDSPPSKTQDTERPFRGRSDTINSLAGFSYESNILPLTLPSSSPLDAVHHSGSAATGRASGDGEGHEDSKHVGWAQGLALVVGMQVGSGIFSSPGVVIAEVGSAGASLGVWVVSGILAWTGASSFAELGCAIPLSGGAQAYLGYAFGPLASYLYTWSAVSVLKPGSGAIISLIFGEYVNRMLYHAFSSDPEGSVPDWTFKITATIAILAVSTLNLISRTMGTSFSIVITTVKVASLIFVFILGLIALLRDGPGPALTGSALFEGTTSNPGSYALAIYSAAWGYDGWDQCNFVAGEMHNPQRDLPRTIHGSMLLVMSLFVGANVAYFVVLDPATVASSNTVALDFGRATLGKAGAVVFSVLVAVSCFGALNNSFYTTSRLIFASARDHFLPSAFAKLHYSRRTPDNAMALNAALTIFFVCFGGGFRSLLNFFSVTSWTFYLLTVLGLMYLRIKEPHLARPYRTYIITPVTFCVVAAFLLLMPIFAAPLEAFAALLFMSAGVPMYYITASSRTAGRTNSSDRRDTSWKAVLHEGWHRFRSDIDGVLPSRYQRPEGGAAGGYASVPAHIQPGESVFAEREERRNEIPMREVHRG